jgi:hypothetical protein
LGRHLADGRVTRRDDLALTIDAFAESGIAVFPSQFGKKGSWVKGWPTMPIAESVEISRTALRRQMINIAGRTGSGFAVLDLDAKTGSPDDIMPVLRDVLEDAMVAVVKTARGFHLWVRVEEEVGNGYCAAIGGEIFSEPHLAMLPPSQHPDGPMYEWVVEPRVPSVAVDLRLLGLVPDELPQASANDDSAGRSVAGVEAQDDFAALMRTVGVHRDSSREQVLVRCPWHEDRHPSLSINWTSAIFHCFSPNCDKRGGLGAIRKLLGLNTPSCRQRAHATGRSSGDKLGCLDVDAMTERLANALQELGEDERAQQVRDCRRYFRVGKCTTCARTPAYPLSCGDPLCVRCMPGRLAADWERNQAALPPRLTLLRLRPGEPLEITGALKKVRGRFGDWRRRVGVASGLYGVRLDPSVGATILLAIPPDCPTPESTSAFQVEVVEEDQPNGAFVRWLQDEYIDEAVTWSDAIDLSVLMLETRARRRFQGFGAAYGQKKEQAAEAEGEVTASKPLGKISGGALKGKRATTKNPACGFCGGNVEWYAFSVPAEQVEKMGDHWLWMGAQYDRAAA